MHIVFRTPSSGSGVDKKHNKKTSSQQGLIADLNKQKKQLVNQKVDNWDVHSGNREQKGTKRKQPH